MLVFTMGLIMQKNDNIEHSEIKSIVVICQSTVMNVIIDCNASYIKIMIVKIDCNAFLSLSF